MLREFASGFVDLIAPLPCIECRDVVRSPLAPFCGPCGERLAWWRRLDGCPRCGSIRRDTDACPGCYSSGSAIHRCHSLLRYEGRVTDWIPRFKHPNIPFGPPLESRIAIEFFANEFARRLAFRNEKRPDLVLSVALHPRRQRMRGFNHSDVIARRIAKALSLPFSPNALTRLRHTPPQANLPAEERRANLRGAFRARPRSLRGIGCLWLVDDVLTTGATLDAAAEACLEAGVDEVHALTLAATPPRRRTQTK